MQQIDCSIKFRVSQIVHIQTTYQFGLNAKKHARAFIEWFFFYASELGDIFLFFFLFISLSKIEMTT